MRHFSRPKYIQSKQSVDFVRILVAIIPLAILLSACDGATAATEVAAEPTSTPQAEATSTATEAPAPIPTSTEEPAATPEPTEVPPTPASTSTPTSSPEPTSTSTATPTPTPVVPQVKVDADLNVRSGPGTEYARIGLLKADTVALIVGRTEDSAWWQIAPPEAVAGSAWISAGYGEAKNTDGVPVVEIPPTPTPAVPTATPIPTTPPVDFVVKHVRLRTNEENGGSSPGGSVSNCGYGHNINILVEDPAGNPVDGVVLTDTYGNLRQITGSRGPGRAEFIFWSNGYQLYVVEYADAGRPVTSDVTPLMSVKGVEIPIPWLIEAHYCATQEECEYRIEGNLLCQGHYSYDLVFQRTW